MYFVIKYFRLYFCIEKNFAVHREEISSIQINFGEEAHELKRKQKL